MLISCLLLIMSLEFEQVSIHSFAAANCVAQSMEWCECPFIFYFFIANCVTGDMGRCGNSLAVC